MKRLLCLLENEYDAKLKLKSRPISSEEGTGLKLLCNAVNHFRIRLSYMTSLIAAAIFALSGTT
jgi:hypothetical protein